MGVVVSKWPQLGGGGGGRERRRSILVVDQDESSRLQTASSIAALEEEARRAAASLARERSQLREQEVLRACRSGLLRSSSSTACRSGLLRSSSSSYQNHGAINHHSSERHDDPGPEEGAEAAAAAAGAGSNTQLSAWVVVERQVHGESETVERWKRLYLEIKTELDDLIQRTRQLQAAATTSAAGSTSTYSCSCGCRGEAMELRGRVSAMERDAARREREMDILRQSLRILTLTNSHTAGIINRGGGRCAPLNLRLRSRMRLSLCLSRAS